MASIPAASLGFVPSGPPALAPRASTASRHLGTKSKQARRPRPVGLLTARWSRRDRDPPRPAVPASFLAPAANATITDVVQEPSWRS